MERRRPAPAGLGGVSPPPPWVGGPQFSIPLSALSGHANPSASPGTTPASSSPASLAKAVEVSVDRFADGAADGRNPLGNLIAVRCGDATVFLAHLQRGSIAVRPGAVVRRGTPLARVGSSGLSPEPHLHVRAERNGKPLAVTFEGRWLVRNAVVRK